jgi:replicative DNA helicase
MTKYNQTDMLQTLPKNGRGKDAQVVSLLRIPPNSPAFEEAVLGAILIDPRCIHEVLSVLEPNDFYSDKNQKIYSAILELFKEGKAIDIRTVTAQLRKLPEDKSQWAMYVMNLTTPISSTAHVQDHALMVREKAIRRSLIALFQSVERMAYSEEADALDLLQNAASELLKIDQRNNRGSQKTTPELVKEAMDDLEHRASQIEQKAISGTPTGLSSLDFILGGLEAGDLVIMAGRPGMGKTSLALCIAKNICLQSKLPVAFFSLEVTAKRIINALFSIIGHVDNKTLKTGRLQEHEWVSITNVAGTLSSAPIFIDDQSGLSYVELRSKCLAIKSKQPDLGLVVVDYLQLMQGDKKQPREQVISDISRNLKLIAKDISVPVIALAQLSRLVEQRGGSKRPILSDLRESGSIEQDADAVVFIYRPEYYGTMEDSEGRSTAGIAELIVSKNRHGDTDTAIVRFDGKTTSFRDLTNSEEILPY